MKNHILAEPENEELQDKPPATVDLGEIEEMEDWDIDGVEGEGFD